MLGTHIDLVEHHQGLCCGHLLGPDVDSHFAVGGWCFVVCDELQGGMVGREVERVEEETEEKVHHERLGER